MLFTISNPNPNPNPRTEKQLKVSNKVYLANNCDQIFLLSHPPQREIEKRKYQTFETSLWCPSLQAWLHKEHFGAVHPYMTACAFPSKDRTLKKLTGLEYWSANRGLRLPNCDGCHLTHNRSLVLLNHLVVLIM